MKYITLTLAFVFLIIAYVNAVPTEPSTSSSPHYKLETRKSQPDNWSLIVESIDGKKQTCVITLTNEITKKTFVRKGNAKTFEALRNYIRIVGRTIPANRDGSDLKEAVSDITLTYSKQGLLLRDALADQISRGIIGQLPGNLVLGKECFDKRGINGMFFAGVMRQVEDITGRQIRIERSERQKTDPKLSQRLFRLDKLTRQKMMIVPGRFPLKYLSLPPPPQSGGSFLISITNSAA